MKWFSMNTKVFDAFEMNILIELFTDDEIRKQR